MEGEKAKPDPKVLDEEKAAKKRVNSKLQEFKKQQKKMQANDIEQQCRDRLWEMLQTGDKAIIEELANTSPEFLVVILFSDTELKSNLILDAIELQHREFFPAVNQRLTGHISLIEAHLQKINPVDTYRRILKHIVRKNVQGEAGFEDWLLAEVVGQPETVLCQLFKTYLNVKSLEEVIIGLKLPKVVEQFSKLAEKIGMEAEAKELKQYAEYHLSEVAWGSNQFNQQNNLKIYSLDILKYNVLHHFANTEDFNGLTEGLLKEDNPNLGLYHELNLSKETPLDVAFRRFTSDQIVKLIEIVEANKKVRLSERTVNELLENKDLLVIEHLLLKTIKFAKSQVISSRGYLTTKAEDCHSPYIPLMHIDPSGKFPLLKYIELSDNPVPEILEELMFPGLSLEDKQQLYSVMLGLNELIKQNGIGNRKALSRIEEFRTQHYEKKIEEFDTYIVQTFETAILRKNEKTIMFLIKNLFNRVILAKVAYGANLRPFLVGKLVEEGFHQAATYILSDFQNLIEFKRPKSLSYNPSVAEPEKSASSPTNDYQLIPINQLAFSISTITESSAALLHFKKLVSQEYLKSPDLLIHILVQGDNIHFPINFIHKFLSAEELDQTYQIVFPPLSEYLASKGDRMLRSFIVQVLEKNTQLIQYFPYDKSKKLINELLKIQSDVDIVEVIRHGRKLAQKVPELNEDLNQLRLSLGSAAGRSFYLWAKKCATQDPEQFIWVFKQNVSQNIFSLVLMCYNTLLQIAKNTIVDSSYEPFIASLPRQTSVRLANQSKAVLIDKLDSDLQNLKRVVYLGSDVIITDVEVTSLLKKQLQGQGFWGNMAAEMITSKISWVEATLKYGCEYFAELKKVMESSLILLVRYYQTAKGLLKSQKYKFGLDRNMFSWPVFMLLQTLFQQQKLLNTYSLNFPYYQILEYILDHSHLSKFNTYLASFLETSKLFQQIISVDLSGTAIILPHYKKVLEKILFYQAKIDDDTLKWILKKAQRIILGTKQLRLVIEKRLGEETIRQTCGENYQKWVMEEQQEKVTDEEEKKVLMIQPQSAAPTEPEEDSPRKSLKLRVAKEENLDETSSTIPKLDP